MTTHATVHYGPKTPPSEAGADDWCRRSLATPVEMEPILDEILVKLEKLGFSKREILAVRLALEEAIMNSIRHGHRFDHSKSVQVRYRVTGEGFLAEVEDEGPGFDPNEVPDPRSAEGLERDGGRGLLLMRHSMTWVRYNERGTCVTLCKCHSRA